MSALKSAINKLKPPLEGLLQMPKRFMRVKRKYPINPEHVKTLPVFDYGVSKKSYNRVFVWGNVQTGALGIPYMKRTESIDKLEVIKRPKRLSFAEKLQVTTATCGFGFSAFAVEDDKTNIKLYGTGINTDSQIGYHAIRADKPMEIIFFPQPIHLPFKNWERAKIKKLSAGRAHLAVLTNEGLFMLGNNAYGQCGRSIIEGENYLRSNYINHLDKIDGKSIIDVECGQDHTLAITEDFCVYSCGWGADGQTGLNFYDNCPEFTQVKGDIASEKIVKVASRSDFVLALSEKGQIFGWGNAEYGQITLSNAVQQVSTPTHLNLNLGRIKDVASGGSFCLIVNDVGDVFVWGYGVLGAGPKVQQSQKPLKLPQVLFGKNDFQKDCKAEKVVCGLSHLGVVTNLGDLYVWGRNLRSCLGLGDEKDQFFPLKVSMAGFVKEVSCGLDHMIAICKPYI